MQIYDSKELKDAIERIKQKDPNINVSGVVRTYIVELANSLHGSEEKQLLDRITRAKNKVEEAQNEFILADAAYKQYLQRRVMHAEAAQKAKEKEEKIKASILKNFKEEMGREMLEEEYNNFIYYYNNPPEGVKNPTILTYCSLIREVNCKDA